MKTYVVSVNNEEIALNSKEVSELDIVKHSDTEYHILQDNKKYSAKLLHTDYLAKKLTVEVNGNNYTIAIADEYDQMVKQMIGQGWISFNISRKNTKHSPNSTFTFPILPYCLFYMN